jgi:hypothetical protein
MPSIATAANEYYFVTICMYCHNSTCIATNVFVAIDPNSCSDWLKERYYLHKFSDAFLAVWMSISLMSGLLFRTSLDQED